MTVTPITPDPEATVQANDIAAIKADVATLRASAERQSSSGD